MNANDSPDDDCGNKFDDDDDNHHGEDQMMTTMMMTTMMIVMMTMTMIQYSDIGQTIKLIWTHNRGKDRRMNNAKDLLHN